MKFGAALRGVLCVGMASAFSSSSSQRLGFGRGEVVLPRRTTGRSTGRGHRCKEGSATQGGRVSMMSGAAVVPAATLTAIIGGSLAGGLHAISGPTSPPSDTRVSSSHITADCCALPGPDHLAAVLPRCIGQRWWRAFPVGAVWAVGHGVSACLLGAVAFFLKGRC